MTALNFPADPSAQSPINTYSPTSTPEATTNGATYLWNGVAWTGAVDAGVSVTSQAVFPETANPNDLIFNTDNGKLYIYYKDIDSEQWVDTSADATSSLVSVSESPPPNPVQGQLWFDSSEDGGVLYIYYSDPNSNQWVEVGGAGGGSGGGTVYSGSNPPENARVNSLWFNDTTGKLYIYYQDADGPQWVDTDVGGTTELMPTGGGNNRIFYENQQTVTESYSFPEDVNAMTAGPVTVGDGVSVTVPAGQSWIIVGGGTGTDSNASDGTVQYWQLNGSTLSPAVVGNDISTTTGVSGATATFSGVGLFGGFDAQDSAETGCRLGPEGKLSAQRAVADSGEHAIDVLSGTTPTFAVLGTGELRLGGDVAGGASNIVLGADGRASFNNVIDLSNDGNGNFQGSITVGVNVQAGNDPDTGVIGSKIYSTGLVQGCCNTGTDYVFAGLKSGSTDKTSFINGDGDASFDGTVTSGGSILTLSSGNLDVGDTLSKAATALTAIKTAATDANTDLAGLKAAIATALANF